MAEMTRRGFVVSGASTAASLALSQLGCDARAPASPPPRTSAPTFDARGGAVYGGAGSAQTGLPDGLDPRNFILHAHTPLSLEPRRSKMGGGPITPASLLFVRNNLPTPDPSIVDVPDAWEVEFGGVTRPATLTVAELKRIGLQTIAAVLQCSGNGRRYFEHGPSGSPWGTGAAGCALWTGVPVRAVIEALGGSVPEAVYLTATGGETLPQLPKDIDPTQFLVERSIPLEKGLRDCLLAWEMNGAPIPLSHGGPVRLIVPGWYGVNNVKYVARLALTAEQSPARIQQTSYRLRPRGEKGDPNQPSMYRMNVKSWLHGPGSDDRPVLVGNVRLHGVAFSGERRVTQVEVSIDGGAVWHPARFVGPDLGPDAWRTFSFDAQLAPGVYEVVSRATDEAGEVQPEVRVDNERGYGNNAWRDMGLRLEVVEVLPPEPPEEPMASPSTKAPVVLSPAGERGRAAFLGANPPCGTCHTLADARVSMGIGPSLDTLAPDRARVTKALRQGLGAMPPYDDRLSSAQIEDIATYLFEATKK